MENTEELSLRSLKTGSLEPGSLEPVNNQEVNDVNSEILKDVISEVKHGSSKEQGSSTHGISTAKEEAYGQIIVRINTFFKYLP